MTLVYMKALFDLGKSNFCFCNVCHIVYVLHGGYIAVMRIVCLALLSPSCTTTPAMFVMPDISVSRLPFGMLLQHSITAKGVHSHLQSTFAYRLRPQPLLPAYGSVAALLADMKP